MTTEFIHPFGICVNILEYQPQKEIVLTIPDEIANVTTNELENFEIFITDPSKLTYSGVNLKSHVGDRIHGIKVRHSTIYNVQVTMKDFNNPEESGSCSQYNLSSYAKCVDNQTHDIISKV